MERFKSVLVRLLFVAVGLAGLYAQATDWPPLTRFDRFCEAVTPHIK